LELVAEPMRGESWVEDWGVGVGELTVVLRQKLANVSCVTVDRGGLDEDTVDGVP
jgi:hypothetical protein